MKICGKENKIRGISEHFFCSKATRKKAVTMPMKMTVTTTVIPTMTMTSPQMMIFKTRRISAYTWAFFWKETQFSPCLPLLSLLCKKSVLHLRGVEEGYTHVKWGFCDRNFYITSTLAIQPFGLHPSSKLCKNFGAQNPPLYMCVSAIQNKHNRVTSCHINI